MAKTKQQKFDEDRRQAMAHGQHSSKAVRRYLEALQSDRSSVDVERLQEQSEKLHAQIAEETSPIKQLQLVQKRIDVEDQLTAAGSGPSIEECEQEFIEWAADYANRKGISYRAYREMGVPAAVLKEAGVPRS